MAKANIELGKLKVQIEGSPEEINDVLEGIREIEGKRETRKERMKLWKKRSEERRYERNGIAHSSANLTDTITQLIKNNYFDDPRIAKEVLYKLRSLGVHVPSTTLHPILARFVMKKILKRNRNDSEVWKYKKS